MVRVCFVCLGNICRSPTAEGIMLHLVRKAGLDGQVYIDSAGTGAWHVGERADPRSRAVAHQRGFELPSIARQFQADDFSEFDYIIAMDRSNREHLERLGPGESVHMLREFDPQDPSRADVPDPYFGGDDGFEHVFDLCERACQGLLTYIRRMHGV